MRFRSERPKPPAPSSGSGAKRGPVTPSGPAQRARNPLPLAIAVLLGLGVGGVSGLPWLGWVIGIAYLAVRIFL